MIVNREQARISELMWEAISPLEGEERSDADYMSPIVPDLDGVQKLPWL